MSNEPRKQIRIDPLELNHETLADLTGQEAEGVQGGRAVAEPMTDTKPLTLCTCPQAVQRAGGS